MKVSKEFVHFQNINLTYYEYLGSLSNRVDETILVKELSSVRLLNSVVRQILLVRNYRQDFLYAKKRNPGYD